MLTPAVPTNQTRGPADAPPPQALLLVRVLTAAAFIVILNETIMANAVPVMMRVFDVTPTSAQWLSTAFLLTMAVTIPVTGWILNRLGTRSTLIVAMGLFCAGTLTAVLAPTFAVLLLARVVQAMGTAIMVPLLMTTLMTVIPEQFRGRVMGSVTLAISVAPATGPLLSGVILEFLSWRWLFGLVLPVAVVVSVVGVRLLPRDVAAGVGRIDVLGVALSAIGFGGLVWGLAGIGEGASDRSASPIVPPWVAVVVGLAGIALLVVRQLRLRRAGREPLLDVTALRHRGFAAGVTVMTVAFGAFLGVMIVLPLVLQQVRGTSVLVAGLVLMPSGLLMGLLGPTVGTWFDVRGARPLIVPGAALVSAGIGGLAWTVTWAPIWAIGLVVGVVGVGLALVFTPIFTASLSDLPPGLYSHGSAILATLQQVGGAAGTAAMISVLSWGAALGVAAGDAPDLGRGGTYALAAAAGLAVLTLMLTPLVPAGRPPQHGPANGVH